MLKFEGSQMFYSELNNKQNRVVNVSSAIYS